MREIPYNREDAVQYARRWALDRNPRYYDFEAVGGDCTNFVSQCIYAGAGVMNETPIVGWFYRSSFDRTASWTGVEYLYRFLVRNESRGPYGHLVTLEEAMPGDIVQLGTYGGGFYHSPIVTTVEPAILVAAHSYDVLDKALSSYAYEMLRVIHIEGVRI